MTPQSFTIKEIWIDYGNIFTKSFSKFKTIDEAVKYLQRNSNIKPSVFKKLTCTVRIALGATDVVFKHIELKGEKQIVINQLKEVEQDLSKF